MRWIPSPLVAAVVLALALTGSACGVWADTTAASVAGRAVSIDSVEDLARDEGFVGQNIEGVSDGRLPGDLFRSVLQFELQRTAWIAEAERWDLEITESDREAARSEVDGQIDAGGLEYEESTRDAIVEFVAAQRLLEERFAQLDPDSDADLRRLYDGVPGLWDQICAAIAFVPPDVLDEVESAMEDGTTIESLPEAVEGATLAADPAQRCVSVQQLPDQLIEALDSAEQGRAEGPAVVSDPSGLESHYVFRVDERRRVGFDDAREELRSIAASLAQQGAQQWISLIVDAAEIDPRYGSGISQNAAGEAVISAPPIPLSDAPDTTGMLGVPSDAAP